MSIIAEFLLIFLLSSFFFCKCSNLISNSLKIVDALFYGGPYITANLYCICSNMKHVLKQMQYRFAVIYETLSTICNLFLLEGHILEGPLYICVRNDSFSNSSESVPLVNDEQKRLDTQILYSIETLLYNVHSSNTYPKRKYFLIFD